MSTALLLAACRPDSTPSDDLDDYLVPTPDPGCVAHGISGVVASGDDGHVAANATDHDPSTRWSNLGKGSFIQVDLGAPTTVCSVAIAWFRGDQRKAAFAVGVSDDGATFQTVASGTSSGTSTGAEVTAVAPVMARHVRITVDGNTANDWASISELAVSAVGDPGPPPPNPGQDPFGVAMLLPTDPDRFSWFLADPNNDARFRIDGDGSNAVQQPDGSYKFKPRKGGLASGGTQLTLRLHVSGTNASESFSNHAELRQRGHMTNDPTHELGDQEMTGYFRIADIEETDEAISKKIRGGRHSSGSASKFAACVGLLVTYDGQGNKMFEKELFHPKTPKFSVDKLFDYGDVVEQGKWIGDKLTSVRQPDGSVVNTQYIDVDPFDAAGTPANHWVKVFEYVDSGKDVVSWSGKVSTWRIDQAKTIFAKFLSVRSVKAQ